MCDRLRLLGVAVLTTAGQEFTHLWPGLQKTNTTDVTSLSCHHATNSHVSRV